jgi:hypothetical protein
MLTSSTVRTDERDTRWLALAAVSCRRSGRHGPPCTRTERTLGRESARLCARSSPPVTVTSTAPPAVKDAPCSPPPTSTSACAPRKRLLACNGSTSAPAASRGLQSTDVDAPRTRAAIPFGRRLRRFTHNSIRSQETPRQVPRTSLHETRPMPTQSTTVNITTSRVQRAAWCWRPPLEGGMRQGHRCLPACSCRASCATWARSATDKRARLRNGRLQVRILPGPPATHRERDQRALHVADRSPCTLPIRRRRRTLSRSASSPDL